MKYLVNLLAHDGIVSQYTGVGTMVYRYIQSLHNLSNNQQIDIHLNLITPVYTVESFGYSEERKKINTHIVKILNGRLVELDNGSNGGINFGDIHNWTLLVSNAADFINKQENKEYDRVINLFNDTPFAGLACKLKKSDKFINVWIPHSTAKIHQTDSALKNIDKDYYTIRNNWEQSAIDFINKNPRNYIAAIGDYARQHLVKDYSVQTDKILNLHNGVLIGSKSHPLERRSSADNIPSKYLSLLDKEKTTVLSFGRAESYKNLEYTLKLTNVFDQSKFQFIVIAQSYYKEQPIIQTYKNIVRSARIKPLLVIDPPFNLAHYILDYADKIIVIIPSERETMGLIINEIRLINDGKMLIVANDVPGLQEQINDGSDGVLISTTDSPIKNRDKILSHLNDENMQAQASRSKELLLEKYSIIDNLRIFFKNIENINL